MRKNLPRLCASIIIALAFADRIAAVTVAEVVPVADNRSTSIFGHHNLDGYTFSASETPSTAFVSFNSSLSNNDGGLGLRQLTAAHQESIVTSALMQGTLSAFEHWVLNTEGASSGQGAFDSRASSVFDVTFELLTAQQFSFASSMNLSIDAIGVGGFSSSLMTVGGDSVFSFGHGWSSGGNGNSGSATDNLDGILTLGTYRFIVIEDIPGGGVNGESGAINGSIDFSLAFASIPEPPTALVMMFSVIGIGLVAFHKKRRSVTACAPNPMNAPLRP